MANGDDMNAVWTAVNTIKQTLDELTTGQRATTVSIVNQLLGGLGAAPVVATSSPPAPFHAATSAGPNGTQSIKAFVATKRPGTDAERMACVAHYMTHHREQTTFRTVDLEKAATEAAAPFSNARVTTANVVRQNRYLASAGNRLYQITSRGEALVNALPNREAVKAALAEHPVRTGKKPGRKRGAKKG